jgi:DNA-binding transcriptional MerR regulator
MHREHTKADIAAARRVSIRTVDYWVARGLLPKPRKWGTTLQARVRWTDEDLAVLDHNLAAARAGVPAPAASAA